VLANTLGARASNSAAQVNLSRIEVAGLIGRCVPISTFSIYKFHTARVFNAAHALLNYSTFRRKPRCQRLNALLTSAHAINSVC